MNNTQWVRLSKLMSYLLRHRPDEAGLKLDEDGMVRLDALLSAIRQRPEYAWVTQGDIREVVAISKKQRFRLEGDYIGARYGHSRRVRPVDPGEPVEPPEILYHGTPRNTVPSILSEGLHPRGRQFVHLSATPDSALRVGRRRDRRPALLLIRAREAHTDGLTFYGPARDTYLVRHVPPAYIALDPKSGDCSVGGSSGDMDSLSGEEGMEGTA